MEIPKFEDIQVSTRTTIVIGNIDLDIRKLFEFLPITDYIVVQKKRGRKKKSVTIDQNKNIKDGSIITLEYQNEIKGVRLKKKKNSTIKKGEDFFRNALTTVMIMDSKKINFKITRNGKFQMTGCRTEEQAEGCVKRIWELIKDQDFYKFHKGEEYFTALFIPAMRNIDFDIGFRIDRTKLDQFINHSTDYRSLLEPNIGYTGVNIKIPYKDSKPITTLTLKKLLYKNEIWKFKEHIPYTDYLNLLSEKDKTKQLNKKRNHTFLVFHSGKIIMSSICAEFAREPYYEFMKILKQNQNDFKEKLIE